MSRKNPEADKVAASSRRYYEALQRQVKAIESGSEDEIDKAAEDVEKARKALDAMVSSNRELVGSAIGAAVGGAVGSFGGPAAGAIGGAAGAMAGGMVAAPTAPTKAANPAEVRKLKAKLLR